MTLSYLQKIYFLNYHIPEGPTNANRIANDESELDSELFDNDSNSVATSDSEISDDDDSDVDASWNVKSFTIDEESIGENQLNSVVRNSIIS
mgnify:CR=1 FL=1